MPFQLISNLTSAFLFNRADNPSIVLVPNLLAEENYAAWKRLMRMALNIEGKKHLSLMMIL